MVKSPRGTSVHSKQAVKKSQGASQSRVSLGDRFGGYVSHHRRIAKESFLRLLAAPIPSIMTWLVIGIALALPCGLFVGLNNVESLSRGWDGAAHISLYMHKRVSEQDGRKLAKKIGLRNDVKAVEFISSTQALEEFKQLSGYGDVLNHLEGNPLPAVIVVSPNDRVVEASDSVKDNTALTRELFKQLQQLPQIEQAVIDLEWVQRLYSMMDLGKRMTLALAALLSLGVLLVIGNTIRLAIESRRDEIVIVKLVGGTNAFVRRPFLYTGIWYGLGGGVMAWAIITISLYWLSQPVAVLAGLYQSEFELQGLGFLQALMLWGVAAFLGLLGAWLAVGRHLGEIEPR